MAVAALARRHGVRMWRRRCDAACGKGKVAGRAVWLFHPRTYMNRSGWAVAAAVDELGLELSRLLVVSDDISLPTGALRLRARGSSGGHKGLQSIIEELDSQEFARLRVGVGDPGGEDAADYVLAPFAPPEVPTINAALARAADAVELWLAEGTARAMAAFNG